MGKHSQQLGKTGEEAAEWYLYNAGFRDIEKIATPMVKTKKKGWVHSKKSSVDFIACMPQPGCIYPYAAARIEVKYYEGDKLPHSVMKPHQVEKLMSWKDKKLPVFVLWVHRFIGSQIECFLFEYPNFYFSTGNSISLEDAKKISWK